MASFELTILSAQVQYSAFLAQLGRQTRVFIDILKLEIAIQAQPSPSVGKSANGKKKKGKKQLKKGSGLDAADDSHQEEEDLDGQLKKLSELYV